MTQIVPVILCGGSGTRLWPRSRAAMPKPFLPLIGEQTIFEADAGALRPVRGPGHRPTGAAHLSHVEAQLGGRGAAIIVEPQARNTAAAIALAALRLPEDAVMPVRPSDHHIGDPQAFARAAQSAAALASEACWSASASR